MDITNLKNNNKYYKDYEEDFEPNFIIRFKNKPEYNINIWEGYVDDIFDTAEFEQDGWKGFTKDNQECVRTFDSSKPVTINTEEYLNDLYKYKSKKFEFNETKDVLDLMIEFLEYGKETNNEIEAWLE